MVQLTDGTGSVVKNYDYDAFGNEKNPDINDNNPFRYCGEYYDKETGTIYLRARYYNPEIGRFISEDSDNGEPNDPLSLNLFTYCQNDPINEMDPSGHKTVISDYTFKYKGNNVTIKKYTFTELGLTVYGGVDCGGALFNNDPIKAYQGYNDSIISYDSDPNGVSVWDLKSVKQMDKDAGWNKKVMWFKAGVSALSDAVSIVKVSKAIKLADGGLQVITSTGKAIYVPDGNISDIPYGSNTYIACSDTIKSKDGMKKRTLNFVKSMAPIIGTYESVKSALNYSYQYLYQNDDYKYDKGHNYDWYQD